MLINKFQYFLFFTFECHHWDADWKQSKATEVKENLYYRKKERKCEIKSKKETLKRKKEMSQKFNLKPH